MAEQEIKVAINGAVGRMGKTIARTIDEWADITITHAYDDPESPDINKRLCDIGKNESQVVIEPSTAMGEGDFDVLIDFSVPDAVMKAAQCCHQNQFPMVIGVTGFSDTQKEEIQTLAQETPILMSPNMSIGVNLCYDLLRQIAQTFWGKNAEVEIIETHHKSKKDKPSGTALRMGEVVAKEKGVDLSDISIESYREGEAAGEHRTFFIAKKERIEIRHEAMDRSPFANGAVYAAQWLVKTSQKPGKLYTMQDALTDSIGQAMLYDEKE